MRKATVFLAVFIACGAVYAFTACHSVSWFDTGEFITACHNLGIPHNPGYPLYCILGKLFSTIVPAGSVAFRVNLMSGLLGALAAATAGLIVQNLTSSWMAGIGGGMLFGFSRSFWSQSTVAEVYTLMAFLLCVLVYLLISAPKPDGKSLKWIALAAGAGIASHLWMALMLPAVIVTAAVTFRKKRAGVRDAAFSLLFFILGLGLYAYLPIRSMFDPVPDWGDPQTPERFFAHLGAYKHPNFMSLKSWIFLWERIKQFAALLSGEYGLIMPFAAAAGLCLLFPRNRRAGWVFLWIVVVDLFYSVFLNVVSVKATVFCIPTFLAFSVLTAVLFAGLGEMLKQKLLISCCLPVMAATLLFSNFRDNDMRSYSAARSFAARVLDTVSKNGVLITGGDNFYFPIMEVQEVEHYRKDVFVVSAELLSSEYSREWYSRQVEAKWDRDRAAIRHALQGGSGIREFIARLNEKSEVFVTNPDFFDADRLTMNGLNYRVAVPGSGTTPGTAGSRGGFETRPYPSAALDGLKSALAGIAEGRRADEETQAVFSEVFTNAGAFFHRMGHTELARRAFADACGLDESASAPYYNMGVTYHNEGQSVKALKWYELAVKKKPSWGLPHYSIGKIYHEKQMFAEALGQYDRAVALGVKTSDLHNRIAVIYAQMEDHKRAEEEFINALMVDPRDKVALKNLRELRRVKQGAGKK